MQEKQSITVRCMDIEDLEKQAEAIRVEQIKLYESYADGVLLRDAYIEKKKALSEKLAALQDSMLLRQLVTREEQIICRSRPRRLSKLLKQMNSFKCCGEHALTHKDSVWATYHWRLLGRSEI